MRLKRFTAAAISALVLAGCSSESSPDLPPGKVDVSQSQEIAAQLAFLDSKEPVIDEADLREYESALDRAQRLCRGSRDKIGRTAFGASETAKDQGLNLSALDMLQILPASVPSGIAPTDCQAVWAAELTILD